MNYEEEESNLFDEIDPLVKAIFFFNSWKQKILEKTSIFISKLDTKNHQDAMQQMKAIRVVKEYGSLENKACYKHN